MNSDSEDDGYNTAALTDYGSGVDMDSEYATDDDAPFNEFLNAQDVIETLVAPEGMQPYEVFRAKRRQARQTRLQAPPAVGTATTTATPDASATPAMRAPREANDDDDDDDEGDADFEDPDKDYDPSSASRVSSRRRHGHGRRARKRKPTRVSRGVLPPQGADLIQQANIKIINGEAAAAVAPLMQCIKLYPNFTDPYMTLAAAFTGLSQMKNALNCYSIALHMKPSDTSIALECAQIAYDLGYLKQAIWAWTKYVHQKRDDHHGHVRRIEIYCEYINQLEGVSRGYQRVLRMAKDATASLLRSFPGDAYAATKMPWILYKMGHTNQAVDFLKKYMAEYDDRIEPTHINMLTQLHLENGHYDLALKVINEKIGLDAAKKFPDLAIKIAVCHIHRGDFEHAADILKLLYAEPDSDSDATRLSAPDVHDLYLDAVQAYKAVDRIDAAFVLLSHYLDSFQTAFDALPSREFENVADLARTHTTYIAELSEMMPLLEECAHKVKDMSLLMHAYKTLQKELPVTHADHVPTTLKLADLLTSTDKEGDMEAAQALMASLDDVSNSTFDMQVKRAEGWLMANNHKEFVKCMSSLIEGVVRDEADFSERLAKATHGLDQALRSRIERIHKGSVPMRADLSEGQTPFDEGIFAAAPGLQTFETHGGRKDRRSNEIRELDRRAAVVIRERGIADLRRNSVSVKQLLDTPGLVSMVLQTLEVKAAAREWTWVHHYSNALLQASKRTKSTSDQQQRDRALLHMFAMLGRMQLFPDSALTAKEQKLAFASWPYSIRAWNLFSRWLHRHESMPMKMVSRLHNEHPDSLPIILQRGHGLLASNMPTSALRHYFQVFEMLPDEPLVNLFIGVGYLAHAISQHVSDRHACVLRAFAFLSRYMLLTSNQQEAAFNMGRALHQLELHHLAAEWYQRALIQKPEAAGSSNHLKFEAAHNLAIIYEGSGAIELAKQLRWKYCSV